MFDFIKKEDGSEDAQGDGGSAPVARGGGGGRGRGGGAGKGRGGKSRGGGAASESHVNPYNARFLAVSSL